ncbi:MAG: hypothetical protein FJ034_07845, partial [Chloroflexi bacterium]|nr:hypothetical protein [Chloroflexota bacterium]
MSPWRRARASWSPCPPERSSPEVLVAGVDSGTQSTKVVIVDIERGDVVAEGRAPHVVQGDGAVRESDPETWYEALATALAQTALASQVDAISIAAQQHGLVLLGKDSRPLHRAILWNDTRAAQDATDLVRALGGPGAWATTI